MEFFITASEERREKRAKRSFSWRQSEDGTKGLPPHLSYHCYGKAVTGKAQ